MTGPKFEITDKVLCIALGRDILGVVKAIDQKPNGSWSYFILQSEGEWRASPIECIPYRTAGTTKGDAWGWWPEFALKARS